MCKSVSAQANLLLNAKNVQSDPTSQTKPMPEYDANDPKAKQFALSTHKIYDLMQWLQGKPASNQCKNMFEHTNL
jgi:hypothetical protein